MTKYVIVLSGKAQSGKTTAGDHIKEVCGQGKQYPYGIHYVPFAAKLKELCRDLFDWDGSKELLTEPDKGRNLLINVGNKLREIRPTLWSDYVVSNIVKDNPEDSQVYLIDDLRYKNELSKVSSLRWHPNTKIILLRVERDKSLKFDHISETDLDDSLYKFDHIIYNNGTISELNGQIDIILSQFFS